MIRFFLTALFLLSGMAVMAVGVFGVYKFRYSANRMHASAINDTLGIGLCLIGLAIGAPDLASALKLLLVLVFFWVSAPASTHLLCRLEIETNENREQYMTVHSMTMQEERNLQDGEPERDEEEQKDPEEMENETGEQEEEEEKA